MSILMTHHLSHPLNGFQCVDRTDSVWVGETQILGVMLQDVERSYGVLSIFD